MSGKGRNDSLLDALIRQGFVSQETFDKKVEEYKRQFDKSGKLSQESLELGQAFIEDMNKELALLEQEIIQGDTMINQMMTDIRMEDLEVTQGEILVTVMEMQLSAM